MKSNQLSQDKAEEKLIELEFTSPEPLRKIVLLDGKTYALVPDKLAPEFKILDNLSTMTGRDLGVVTGIDEDWYTMDFGKSKIRIIDQYSYKKSGTMHLVHS